MPTRTFQIIRLINRALVIGLLIVIALSTMQLPVALAHGGDDHGDEQSQLPIATSAQMNVKIGKTSALEVLVKYPTPQAGEETLLRVFVTDQVTNTPVTGLKVGITLSFVSKSRVAGLFS